MRNREFDAQTHVAIVTAATLSFLCSGWATAQEHYIGREQILAGLSAELDTFLGKADLNKPEQTRKTWRGILEGACDPLKSGLGDTALLGQAKQCFSTFLSSLDDVESFTPYRMELWEKMLRNGLEFLSTHHGPPLSEAELTQYRQNVDRYVGLCSKRLYKVLSEATLLYIRAELWKSFKERYMQAVPVGFHSAGVPPFEYLERFTVDSGPLKAEHAKLFVHSYFIWKLTNSEAKGKKLIGNVFTSFPDKALEYKRKLLEWPDDMDGRIDAQLGRFLSEGKFFFDGTSNSLPSFSGIVITGAADSRQALDVEATEKGDWIRIPLDNSR